MTYDPLIYGKNAHEERIVSIEIDDDKATLFKQTPDGQVETKVVSNKFWMLASSPVGKGWTRLSGDLHYKWGRQFSTREEFLDARNRLRHRADTYSVYDAKEAFQINFGYTYFQNLKVNEISINAFDIETTGLDSKARDAKVLLIANTLRKGGVVTRKLFDVSEYGDSEAEMITAWCAWVREQDPSILCGHNIVIYDFPYLAGRAKALGIELNLGRLHGANVRFNDYESQLRKDGSQSYSYKKCYVYGREIVDTFFLAIKYDIGRKYENYKLKSIIAHEGLEVAGRVFYDAGTIRENWHDLVEREKIRQYSIYDGDDALALFDLMSPALFYMTRSVPKPFQMMMESASGSQLNGILVRSYLQNKHSVPKADDIEEFEGAISFGIPGIYHNAVRYDFSGMYVSIMLQYEIYPAHKDPQRNFLNMLSFFSEERLKNKKLAKETGEQYYKDLDAGGKQFANSAYGMQSARGLNFNNSAGAAAITKKGRELLNHCIKWATGNDVSFYDQYRTKKDAADES